MTIARMIDLKHGITTDGKLVKVLADGEEQEIPEGEPTILFRGRDKLALPMLHFYYELCREDGATDYQLTSVREMCSRFGNHASTNVTKQPGITRGMAWDGQQS